MGKGPSDKYLEGGTMIGALHLSRLTHGDDLRAILAVVIILGFVGLVILALWLRRR